MFELTENENEDEDEDPQEKYLKNKKTADTTAGTNSNSPYPIGKRESDFSRSTKKTIGFVL